MPGSGVSYNSELEIGLAAQWWGHKSVSTFQELPPHEQAYDVAIYRAQNRVSGLVALAQAEKQRLQNARKGRRGGH